MSELQAVSLTYEPFSLQPEYVEANRGFVGRQRFDGMNRMLDLACGNGVVSELLAANAPGAHLHGVDYDPVQIDLIANRFSDLGYAVRRGFDLTDDRVGGRPVATFGVASADDVPFPDASFDCVTIANAIHMLPDKGKLLTTVRRLLKPGGVFGFNSAFYAGTLADGTQGFYAEWMKEAFLYIEGVNARLQSEGKPKLKRIRGTSHKAFQNRWYSRHEWIDLLAQNGLVAHDVNERVVRLDSRCFAAIGAYGGFADVLMSGYPVEIASEALQATVDAALARVDAVIVPRHWLEVWATKSAA